MTKSKSRSVRPRTEFTPQPEPYITVTNGKRKRDFLVFGQAVQDIERVAKLGAVSVSEVITRCLVLELNRLEAQAKEAAIPIYNALLKTVADMRAVKDGNTAGRLALATIANQLTCLRKEAQ